MTDTLETLRHLAPEVAALADLPWDVQLIDNTADEAERVQQEIIAAIEPVLEMLAEALGALEKILEEAQSDLDRDIIITACESALAETQSIEPGENEMLEVRQ